MERGGARLKRIWAYGRSDWGGGEMFKGLFYDFESEDQFVALVEKVRGKCEEKDGCLIWQGRMVSGQPRYFIRPHNLNFVVRRLIFQAENPEYMLPKRTFTIACSCGNDKCLSHLVLTARPLWDVDNIQRRIVTGSKRAEPNYGLDTGCLLWQGFTHLGYGKMQMNDVPHGVHKLSLLIHSGLQESPVGPDGQKLIVRHRCPNKNCCEASHLEWGTSKQNADDRKRDGTNLAGEKNPRAKMSAAIAAAIKLSWRPQTHPEFKSAAQRATEFGVTYAMVNNIDQGMSWASLPAPPNQPIKTTKERTRVSRDDLSQTDIKNLAWRIAAKVRITHGISKDPTITTPCHIYTGYLSSGYGIINYHNLTIHVHIIACENKMNQRTPEGLLVRHTCGNKHCANPGHLKFGTPAENFVDSVLHGDIVTKLSPEDVRKIRNISLMDKEAILEAVEEYGVYDTRYIRDIINSKVWAFVE
jgi:HNH endonuclease